ncbi:MAG: GtrA family protein [Clostridia bacterium]|nr:GtrA family protein [Clostridia bacterium]
MNSFILKIKKLKEIFFSKRFLYFCLFGCINTFDTALFSWIFHLIHIQSNISAAFGFVFSLGIAYLLNSRFVFKRKPSAKGLLRFFISYIPTFIIYFLVTFITINIWHFHQFWATALSVLLGSPVAFLIMWIYTFSRD